MSFRLVFLVPLTLALLTILALTACITPAAARQRYTGQLAGCAAPMPATLVRQRDRFAFTPDNGALMLRGRITPDGHLAATLNTQPPGKPPYVLAVEGTIDGAAARLRYTTPRCAATGTLSPAN